MISWLATQEVAVGQDNASTATGTWVGWLETPLQHLRLIVRIQSLSESSTDSTKFKMEGTITSPDQSPDAVPFAAGSINQDGNLEFAVAPPENPKLAYSIRGKRNGDLFEGWFENAKAKLPLSLYKVEAAPDEGSNRLGANTAWTGELDIAVQKIAVRFRVYDQLPYADPESPRILFDSLTEKVNGFPVVLSSDAKRQVAMSIPSLPGKAKYLLDSDSLPERIRGRFLQNLLPLSLELTRVAELADRPLLSDPLLHLIQNLRLTTDPVPLQVPNNSAMNSTSELPADGVREEAFIVERIDYLKPRVKQDGRWVQPKFRISGTVTWPADGSPKNKVPAVVMVSGSGPQDRNETIGVHQPFRMLAQWFAAHGVASLRYDDRGVGDSTGDFLTSTTADFADDAAAVWEYARTLEGIDPLRVGLLGHSEGGIIGPSVAANQMGVAFLILLAPPALPGSEILAAQIDRMAEVQGVDGPTRRATMALQRELQRLALGPEIDNASRNGEIQRAVLEQWESLRGMSEVRADEPESVRRQRVIDQIAKQFKGLQTPWMRYFLACDPTPPWLVMRSPTLAIWGEKDVQVLAGPNRLKLLDVTARNSSLQREFVVLPEINHLMQRAKTGLPDEYDQISDTIDKSVLEVIREWMQQRLLIR
jgi:pimeloyl-ACP methyl ester carboxylesterase